jgi:hypothetical protein
MAIVDQQGRLFGRFNVIDAVVAVFVVGLIPLLYAAAVLFRVPPPVLTGIQPAALQAGSGGRVTIKGENLRPYMRVSFGNNQGINFLFKSITEAEVDLNAMPPGVYDVVLYDVAQEQARLPQALTILPPPLPATRVTLVGVFGNLDAERAKLLKPGDVVEGVGTIRVVGTPMPSQMRVTSNGLIIEIAIDRAVMLPAEVEGSCEMPPQSGMPYCLANGTSLQPTVVLMGQHAAGKLPFQIDQLRGPGALHSVEVVARFAGPARLISGIRAGDIDLGMFTNPLSAGATVVDVRRRSLTPDVDQAEVTLQLKAEHGSNGWVYGSLPLRGGADIAFRNGRYQVNGPVISVRPEWTPAK